MKKLIALACLVTAAAGAYGVEITTCRNPIGRAFYHFSGLTDKPGAGWAEDKITDGTITLSQLEDGSFDILYLDIRKKPISTVQDGGLVRLLRRSSTTLTLIVLYPNATTEIYSFFQEKDGRNRFTQMQNKTGDGAPFPKSGVMVGDCDTISFDLLK